VTTLFSDYIETHTDRDTHTHTHTHTHTDTLTDTRLRLHIGCDGCIIKQRRGTPLGATAIGIGSRAGALVVVAVVGAVMVSGSSNLK
jgi:hypothetical protein